MSNAPQITVCSQEEPPNNLLARETPSELEPKWATLLDTLPLGVAVISAQNGQTVWSNRPLKTLLQQAVGNADILGQSPTDYLPEIDPGVWEQALQMLLQQRQPGALLSSHRLQFVHHATRNISYWEWTLQRMDDAPNPAHLMLTVQSVSETVMNERLLASAGRTAERARQRAEALVRVTELVNASVDTQDLLAGVTHEAASFFDTAYAAVLLICPDQRCFTVGYGMGLTEIDGHPYHPEIEGTLAMQALAKRQTVAITHTGLHPSDTPMLAIGTHPTALVSSPIHHGETAYGVLEVYFTEYRDVPEDARSLLAAFAHHTAVALHKADLYAKIAEQRRQLQSIFDNAPVSIAYFDTGGRILTANAAAAQTYGFALDSVIGMHYHDLMTDLPKDLFERVRAGKPFHASHHIQRRQEQGESVCDVSLLPVRSEGGEVVGLLLLSFDVTALVTARREADVAREAAENALEEVRAAQIQMVQMEKMRAIGELASGVAHDFNNALMAVLGYAELAEETLDDPTTLASYLTVIKRAAEDASSTVKRLQRFARQRVTTQGQPTDVNAVVRDVIEMTRPHWRDAAQKEGVTYIVQANLSELPSVHAEPSGLREVLVNLIHNALHAMPEGGSLTLTTRMHGDNEIEIEVKDTGIGMTPEVAERIFDPFFTTRGVEGTGLGLAVSWSIVQRHGGTIEVETEPGAGTRFLLRFPTGEDHGPVALTQKAATPLSTRSASILVVDDETFIASVLTSILTRNGHRVTTAQTGTQALERLRGANAHFDLVLTDHGMPGMNGLQLVAEIKRSQPHLPVILLTGWGASLLQTHVVETMPDAILGKPINQSDLLETVAKTLRESTEKRAPVGESAASG